MKTTLILLFVVVGLVAYIESKKPSEGNKDEKQQNEGKHGQKDKYKQKESQESRKGKDKKTKENVNQKDEQKEKYKGKHEKTKKDEKSEKATKDAEKKQQKKEKTVEPAEKDQKQEQKQQKKEKTETSAQNDQKESCSKDISCEKASEPEATSTVCIVHGDCQPGSCCKPPGVCQEIGAREGQKCWNSCMCGGGLLCFSDGGSKDATGICKIPVPEDLAGGSYLQ